MRTLSGFAQKVENTTNGPVGGFLKSYLLSIASKEFTRLRLKLEVYNSSSVSQARELPDECALVGWT
jgi:hypothetical protein